MTPDDHSHSEVFEEGALVEVVKDHPDAPGIGARFEIVDYVPADKAEDGRAFYWGSRNGGMNNVTCPADCVRQVDSADEMAARCAPTCEEVADAIGLAMHTDHRGLFEVDESEADGDCLNLYAGTSDGLRIEIRLQVVSVEECDF